MRKGMKLLLAVAWLIGTLGNVSAAPNTVYKFDFGGGQLSQGILE
jgi:hypothetical protein